MPVNKTSSPTLLSLDTAEPLSIRAKALVFHDPSSLRLLNYVEKIGPSEAPVLIYGETGTGKELLARHIHRLSGRAGPFLAVNCGAISDQLAESELFGHEAGSFTGAIGQHKGWFEAANHGTLFLDEIGDLPLPLQVKLLRVIQEREVVRLGSTKTLAINVRLLAGTNINLEAAVQAERFRQDLLYRINIAKVTLPPLRERAGDILPLAEHFLQLYSKRMSRGETHISAAAAARLLAYAWPGNIRELENVIHFALLVAPGNEITPEHLRVSAETSSTALRVQHKHSADPQTTLQLIGSQLRELFAAQGTTPFDDIEKLIINEAFSFADQNQVKTANLLGISRNVVRTLLKRHALID